MICKKTGSYFRNSAFKEQDICYYHHPKNKRSNFSSQTMKTIVKDGYACNAVLNFIRIKYEQKTGNKL